MMEKLQQKKKKNKLEKEIKLLVLSSEKLILDKKKLRDLMCKTLRNEINNLKGDISNE
tara:strand:+ start:728 stop:901 length:174 start_codon:yes stop_codon:yes gene_type:complete